LRLFAHRVTTAALAGLRNAPRRGSRADQCGVALGNEIVHHETGIPVHYITARRTPRSSAQRDQCGSSSPQLALTLPPGGASSHIVGVGSR